MWIFEVIWWSSYKKCNKGEFQKSVFFIVDPTVHKEREKLHFV